MSWQAPARFLRRRRCLRSPLQTVSYLTATPFLFLSDPLQGMSHSVFEFFWQSFEEASVIFPWVFLGYDSPPFVNSTRPRLVQAG